LVIIRVYTWLIQPGRADTGRYGGYWHNGLYRQVWLTLAQWLIQAGMADTGTVADTGTMAYTGRYGGY